MHVPPRFVLTALLTLPLASFASAQEAPPAPAAELEKLASMVGHWQGSGTANMGPQPSKWQSQTTCAWSLGNHFLQEDTRVTFEGMPQPLVFRAYLGWDRENSRYVSVSVNNEGEASINRVERLPDGTLLQFSPHHKDGMTYIERSRSRADGDEMNFSIDLLTPDGPSMEVVRGTMKKVARLEPMPQDASAFNVKPHEQISKLARMTGTYAVEGSMVMMPGTPPMKISGIDTVAPLFDGTIVHARTIGHAEGQDAEYEAHNFFAWDAIRECIVSAFVSNMGEVGTMDNHLSEDGKALISTTAATYMGQPCSQRYVLELDAKGAMAKATGHCLIGTTPPYESFKATYRKE